MLARVREPGEYTDRGRAATLTEAVPGVPAQWDTACPALDPGRACQSL
ncbi:hypothetical protein GCM10010236_29060 [Streptomyces eurythermus]|nr:hypothetical protein GCM10010236_29060 [Streptomyces eurythermus]